MPTMTELAIVLFAVAFIFGLGALLHAIQDPASRKEMGIRLPEDDQ
jgi:hypothetical protein